MYTPTRFDETRHEVLHARMGEHPFGPLVTQGADVDSLVVRQGLQSYISAAWCGATKFLNDSGK